MEKADYKDSFATTTKKKMMTFAAIIIAMFLIFLFALWNSTNNQFVLHQQQTKWKFDQASHKVHAIEKKETSRYEEIKGKIDDSNSKIDSIQKNLDIKIH